MKPTFLLLFSFFITFQIFAQKQPKGFLDHGRIYPIEITIGNHALSLPFYRMIRLPWHPALTLGTEFDLKKTENHHVFVPVRLGFFYNKYSATALSLSAEIGYRYTHKTGIYADAAAGLGYLHSFLTSTKIVFENGVYNSDYDFGKPALITPLWIGAGYDFYQRTDLPLAIFVRYTWFAQIPYNGYMASHLSQTILAIGVRFSLKGRVKCPE